VRILQIHTRYRIAGGEDAVADAEASLLEGAGHEVVRWRHDNPGGALSAVAALALSPWNPVQGNRLVKAAAGAAPDIAHVHNLWFATSAAGLRGIKKLGIPIVMTLHNYRLACANGLLQRDGAPCERCIASHPWHAVRYGCYRDSRPASIPAAGTIAFNRAVGTWTRHVDRFLALTEFARGRMIAAGLPQEKVIVKPNFVSDPGPRPRPPSASDYVLFAGRLSPEKGIATLLAAWRRKPTGGLRLLVAGDGPLAATLGTDLPSGVEMLGRVAPERVGELMLGARALLFPSEWYEGQPMTLLEAFAAALPVVVSDLGSMTEMIADLGPDWLVPPGDPAAWAAAIAGLDDPAAVDRASVIARRMYDETYSEERGIANLEAAYRAL